MTASTQETITTLVPVLFESSGMQLQVDVIDPLVAHLLSPYTLSIDADNVLIARDNAGVIKARSLRLNQGRKITVALRIMAFSLN